MLRVAFGELIGDRLLHAEADWRGVSLAALLDIEVDRKKTVLIETEIRDAYGHNAQPLGGAPLEAVRAEIVAALDERNRDAARAGFVERLRAEHAIESLLGPLRVPVGTEGTPGRRALDLQRDALSNARAESHTKSGATKWLRSALSDHDLRPPACSGAGGMFTAGGLRPIARFLQQFPRPRRDRLAGLVAGAALLRTLSDEDLQSP